MSDSIPQRDIGQGPAQAGYSLRVVLPLITVAVLAQNLMKQGLPVLYPFIQDEFSLSLAQVGLITSFQAVGFAVAVLLAGWLTDSFGVKRIITFSLLALTAFTSAFAVAYSFPLVLGLAVLTSMASAPLHPATALAVMDWFPARIRALAMSFRKTGVPLGGAIMASALPALTLVIGWRLAAAVSGFVVLATAFAFIALYRDAPRLVQTSPKFNFATVKTILWKSGLLTTIIWGSVFCGFQSIVLSYFMLFLMEDQGLSAIAAGGLLALAQVCSIFARVLWGAVSDFIFRGRRIVVLAITGFLTVLWMLGVSLPRAGIPTHATMYAVAIIIGISTLSFHGVANTLWVEQAEPGQVGMTIGAASTINNGAQMVMPPLFGYLVDITSSYSLGWRVVAVAALIVTLLLMIFGKEPQRVGLQNAKDEGR